MSAKRSKVNRITAQPVSRSRRRRVFHSTNRRSGNRGLGNRPAIGRRSSQAKLRSHMPAKNGSSANEYLCAIEKTQNGKYNVRVRAAFGRGAWSLPIYFLASSFN